MSLSTRVSVLTLGFAALAAAADFYASPSGSPGGDGTRQRPLDLETALSAGSPAGPGDTLYLRGGVYRKGSNPYLYLSRLAGQPNQHVTVRSAPGEKASIDGGIEIVGAWSIYRDLDIFSSSAVRYTSETGSWPSGIKAVDGLSVFATNVKLINNTIRDARLGVSSWKEASNNEIYGNLISYSGWQAPDRAHGHGIYAQNQGGAKVIAENVVSHQFRHGLQFYGSDSAPLENLVLEGNVFFNSGSLAQGNEFSRNILIGGGQPARNPVIRHNHSYFPPAASSGDNNVGYWPSGAGCQNLTFEDNRLVSGGRALAMTRCSVSSLRRNLIAGPVHGFSPSQYPSNTYLPNAPTSGVEVFVRPNKYESGRAHVIVYNWERRNTVAVDVSAAGLRPGDSYDLINVQNPEFDVRSGVYSGSPLNVNMTNRTVASPTGWTAPDSTFPQFGVFLLVKTSGGAPAPDQQAPVVTLVTPTNGSVIEGTVGLEAVASDNVGVTRVRFYLNGQPVAADDYAAPYRATLDAAALSPGVWRLSAEAHDAAGNSTETALVTVTVPAPSAPAPAPSPAPEPAPKPSPSPGPATDFTLLLDAEQGQRSDLRIGHDGAAIGGRYVIGQRVGGSLTFNLNLPAAVDVSVWGRGRAASADAGSWTILIDGAAVGRLQFGASAWRWAANGGAARTALRLPAGSRRLTFRADGFKGHVDAFVLTSDPLFQPTDSQPTPLP